MVKNYYVMTDTHTCKHRNGAIELRVGGMIKHYHWYIREYNFIE